MTEERSQTAPATARSDVGTRITVVVRVRPPNQREIASAQGNVVHVVDDRVLTFDPPGERIQKQTFLQMGVQRAKNLHFGFDKVLSASRTQEDVFDVVKSSVFAEKGGFLDGFNCTVFAYGATGSGKTFSMTGTPENPGLMARAVEHIYSALEQNGRRAKLKLSYLEIYNENIQDLLVQGGDSTKLKIVDDPEHGIVVTNLKHCYPKNTDEVLSLIQMANNRRTQAQTESNPVSSRSHAVCQITVENCDDIPGVSSDHPIGKLSLIDLAGSERATTNTGIRLKESAKINCSLLALSNCINALCTQSSFIPFRQSKLTRLLKDSLGGNCKTVCLSCISPSYMSYDDTYSTLQYANKTKNIRTNVTRNTLNVRARISQYPQIIAELRAQILALQANQGGNRAADQFRKAIDGPFQIQKSSIKMIAAREIEENDMAEMDMKQQMLAIQRMSDSDVRRKMNQKVAVFATECNKKRPVTSGPGVRAFEAEQQLKTLELENFALRSQLEIREKQISMQQSVIEQLYHEPAPLTSSRRSSTDELSHEPPARVSRIPLAPSVLEHPRSPLSSRVTNAQVMADKLWRELPVSKVTSDSSGPEKSHYEPPRSPFAGTRIPSNKSPAMERERPASRIPRSPPFHANTSCDEAPAPLPSAKSPMVDIYTNEPPRSPMSRISAIKPPTSDIYSGEPPRSPVSKISSIKAATVDAYSGELPQSPVSKISSIKARITDAYSSELPHSPVSKIASIKARVADAYSGEPPRSPTSRISSIRPPTSDIYSDEPPRSPISKISSVKATAVGAYSNESPQAPVSKISSIKARTADTYSNESPRSPVSKIPALKLPVADKYHEKPLDGPRTHSPFVEKAENDDPNVINVAARAPLSARRGASDHVSISDASGIQSNAAIEASRILRQRFQDARPPLADRNVVETSAPPIAKPPMRSLMDQLSQRVAAAAAATTAAAATPTDNDDSVGILFRSRLLTKQ